jgi:hypothetical protein
MNTVSGLDMMRFAACLSDTVLPKLISDIF